MKNDPLLHALLKHLTLSVPQVVEVNTPRRMDAAGSISYRMKMGTVGLGLGLFQTIHRYYEGGLP